MPKRLCESPREGSPLRDRRSFETDDECEQYLAQRRKQHETLRDVNATISARVHQRDRSKRLRPKRDREHAERREAAATQRAAKATAAEAAVVEAARQRAAAEQRAGITQAAHVCTASVPVMCRFDTAYKKSM